MKNQRILSTLYISFEIERLNIQLLLLQKYLTDFSALSQNLKSSFNTNKQVHSGLRHELFYGKFRQLMFMWMNQEWTWLHIPFINLTTKKSNSINWGELFRKTKENDKINSNQPVVESNHHIRSFMLTYALTQQNTARWSHSTSTQTHLLRFVLNKHSDRIDQKKSFTPHEHIHNRIIRLSFLYGCVISLPHTLSRNKNEWTSKATNKSVIDFHWTGWQHSAESISTRLDARAYMVCKMMESKSI